MADAYLSRPAMGHERRFGHSSPISAVTPEADIAAQQYNSRIQALEFPGWNGWKNFAGIVGLVSLDTSYVRNERRSKWNMKSCPVRNGSSGEFCCSSMKKPSLSIVILCLPSACACHGFASRKNISSMLRTES